VFAGLRPLVAGEGSADTTRLSRSHRLFAPLPGLTAIAGGKFTTYRVMAKDAVDAAARDLGSVPASATDRLPLLGAEGPAGGAAHDPASGLGREQFARLIWRHGSCASEVLDLIAADPSLAAPLPGDPRHVAAEVVHAYTHQGALDVDDVLSRRTRISIEVADRGRAAAPAVAALAAGVFGWSDVRRVEEMAHYLQLRDAEAAAEASPDEATARARYREALGGRVP
jgi:glycerol-3-phosphate dehydrogenase